MPMPQEHDYTGLSEDKSSVIDKNIVLNLKETELRLGLPGWEFPDLTSGVRVCLFGKDLNDKKSSLKRGNTCLPVKRNESPASKTQVVGWPPVRRNSYGKTVESCLYVKVSMDGAPYLRKIDLRNYSSYAQLSSALENMFTSFTIGDEKVSECETQLMDLLHGSESVLTYQDKDGDWMLVGDVPWEMFLDSCKRLRIMKSSDAIGLGMAAKAI